MSERSDNRCAGKFAKNEIPINWTNPSLETNRNNPDGLTIINTPPPPTFELNFLLWPVPPSLTDPQTYIVWDERDTPLLCISLPEFTFFLDQQCSRLGGTLSDPLCSTPSIDLSLSVLPDLLLFSCPGGTFPSLLSHT